MNRRPVYSMMQVIYRGFQWLKDAVCKNAQASLSHFSGHHDAIHSKRAYGLDLIRGIAILVVVYVHGLDFFPKRSGYLYLFTLDGVAIFFVLSGFLIGSILIGTVEQSAFEFKDILVFWKRRWFRTLPNYYLVLIVLTIHEVSYHGIKFIAGALGKYYLFSQNISGPSSIPFFAESWSLAVEEWFYLTIPICILMGLKLGLKKKTVLLSVIGVFILAPMVFRTLYWYHSSGLDAASFDNDIRKVTVTRLDAIGFGVLGAFIKRYLPKYWNQHHIKYGIVGLGLLVFKQWWMFHASRYGAFEIICLFPVESAGVLLLIAALENIRTTDRVTYRFITWTSLISYSIYLLHYSTIQQQIVEAFSKRTQWCHGWAAFVMYIGLIYAMASLLHIFWENPMMNLRDRAKRAQDGVV